MRFVRWPVLDYIVTVLLIIFVAVPFAIFMDLLGWFEGRRIERRMREIEQRNKGQQ
jgi:hypothetical protein